MVNNEKLEELVDEGDVGLADIMDAASTSSMSSGQALMRGMTAPPQLHLNMATNNGSRRSIGSHANSRNSSVQLVKTQDIQATNTQHQKLRKSTTLPTPASTTINTSASTSSRIQKHNKHSALRQLWSLLRQQIFLGMAASSVPVRKDVPNSKEDLEVAGIRFVYFSAQNMKRSKPVAEKLGIAFDWNCAISLRSIEDGHDPHRHISSYADWDVMGQWHMIYNYYII
jgi:hypothetical protein